MIQEGTDLSLNTLVLRNDIEGARVALSKGVELTTVSAQLHLALRCDNGKPNPAMIDLLLRYKANPIIKDAEDTTPLTRLALEVIKSQNIAERVPYLAACSLLAGAIHAQTTKTPEATPSSDLLEGFMTPDIDKLLEIMLTVDIGFANKLGNALHTAALHMALGDMLMVILLARGCDMRFKNPESLSVLHVVVKVKNALAFDFLSKHESFSDLAKTEDAVGRTPLMVSIIYCHWIAEALLPVSNIHQTDASGHTALHYAALFNRPTIVASLLAKGADKNAINKLGTTPMGMFDSRKHILTPKTEEDSIFLMSMYTPEDEVRRLLSDAPADAAGELKRDTPQDLNTLIKELTKAVVTGNVADVKELLKSINMFKHTYPDQEALLKKLITLFSTSRTILVSETQPRPNITIIFELLNQAVMLLCATHYDLAVTAVSVALELQDFITATVLSRNLKVSYALMNKAGLTAFMMHALSKNPVHSLTMHMIEHREAYAYLMDHSKPVHPLVYLAVRRPEIIIDPRYKNEALIAVASTSTDAISEKERTFAFLNLVKHGANIEYKDDKDNTALLVAGRLRTSQAISTLIELGADIYMFRAPGGFSLVGYAAKHYLIDVLIAIKHTTMHIKDHAKRTYSIARLLNVIQQDIHKAIHTEDYESHISSLLELSVTSGITTIGEQFKDDVLNPSLCTALEQPKINVEIACTLLDFGADIKPELRHVLYNLQEIEVAHVTKSNLEKLEKKEKSRAAEEKAQAKKAKPKKHTAPKDTHDEEPEQKVIEDTEPATQPPSTLEIRPLYLGAPAFIPPGSPLNELLIAAAQEGNLALVQEYLDQGANIDHIGECGSSAAVILKALYPNLSIIASVPDFTPGSVGGKGSGVFMLPSAPHPTDPGFISSPPPRSIPYYIARTYIRSPKINANAPPPPRPAPPLPGSKPPASRKTNALILTSSSSKQTKPVLSGTFSRYLNVLRHHENLQRFMLKLNLRHIDIPIEDVLDPKRFKELSLQLHPDKGANIDRTALFPEFMELKTHLDEEINIKAIFQESLTVCRATIMFKALDVSISSARFYYFPTFDNAKGVGTGILHLYSMTHGFDLVSVALVTTSFIDTYCKSGFTAALQQTSLNIAYMALYAAATVALGTYGMLGLTVCHTASNAYNFYTEMHAEESNTITLIGDYEQNI